MGSGRVPPSSLDSLMLAYTDLSAPTKGTGFKVLQNSSSAILIGNWTILYI